MTEITIAVLDDFEAAHAWIEECFGKQASQPAANDDLIREGIRLVGQFRPRLVKETEAQIRHALRSFKGPLLLFLDLTFGLSDERLPKIIAGLKRRVSRIHHPGRNRALNYLEGLPQLDLDQKGPTAIRQLEGVWMGLEAILNLDINPLHIKIATRGDAGGCPLILEILGSKYRSPECFRVEEMDTSLTDLHGFYEPAETKGWEKIVQPAVEELRTSILRCRANPDDRLEEYLRWIAGAHDSLDDGKCSQTRPLEAILKQHLLPFLGIPAEDWSAVLWPAFQAISDQGVELLKRTGSYGRDRLCVSGGWLLALAAFQSLGIQRSWQDVFRPQDLSKAVSSSSLTPVLSVPKDDAPDNLHDALRRFFRLCVRLFEPKGSSTSSLLKVSLSDQSLEFLLDFDAWNHVDGWDQSLIKKLMKWRDGYLKGRAGNPWTNEISAGPAATSRAIWDWWLLTSLDDFKEGMVSPSFKLDDHWKLSLRRDEKRTKVIFSGNKK